MMRTRKALLFCVYLCVLGLVQGKTVSMVNDVTTQNIDQFFTGKGSFLLEFYAPWCGHCRQFEPIYEKVAGRLSGDDFKIGKANVAENQALQSRFNVRYLPMILLVRDGNAYIYDGSLTYTDLASFATSDYKVTEPLSFWDSPFGPVGTVKGLLTRAGVSLLSIHPWIMSKLGVSEAFAYLLVAVCIAGAFFSAVFAGVFVQIQGLKND